MGALREATICMSKQQLQSSVRIVAGSTQTGVCLLDLAASELEMQLGCGEGLEAKTGLDSFFRLMEKNRKEVTSAEPPNSLPKCRVVTKNLSTV